MWCNILYLTSNHTIKFNQKWDNKKRSIYEYRYQGNCNTNNNEMVRTILGKYYSTI